MVCSCTILLATVLGLLAGVVLSALSCFFRSLRRSVPYFLLVPVCAVAGSVFLEFLFMHAAVLRRDFSAEDMLRNLFGFGLGWSGALAFGALLGSAGGFFLARFVSHRFNHRITRSSEVPPAGVDGSRSP
jgi:hypothetical protein